MKLIDLSKIFATIENNHQQFSKVLQAQYWIATRCPQQANSLLMVGFGKNKNIRTTSDK
jgi:hypothetical protein